MRLRAYLPAFSLSFFACGAQLFPIQEGRQCGYADSAGRVAIAVQYQDCQPFSEGVAAVEAGDRWGYVDEKGGMAIAPQFRAANGFSEGLAFVTAGGGSKVVVDRQGKVKFAADYYRHGKFSEGLARVEVVTAWMCPDALGAADDACTDKEKTPLLSDSGYIDTSGAMVIPPHFDEASDFHEALAYADGGFIDRTGKTVIQGHFYSATSFSSGVAAVEAEFDRWGYIDKTGAALTQPVFDEAGPIQDGRGLVKQDGLYGFVDVSGALVIPPHFEKALPFSEEKAAVRQGGKWGYIDKSGAVVIAMQYDDAQSFDEGHAEVALGTHAAVIDEHGVEVASRPATLAQTFQRLQGFEVKPREADPLAEVIPILAAYKEQLRQVAAECLRDADDAAGLESAIEDRLQKAGIREAKDEETRPYGLVDVEVVQPPQHPELREVLFHLNLSDAVDTSLSIFERHGGIWDLVYRLDRNDYFKWSGEAYHIAPPKFTAAGKDGSFLMLMASDSGRSGDGGYGLWVDLYRVSADFRMDVLFHKDFGGKADQIALDPDGFRLEMLSFEVDAVRAGLRVFPYRYRVNGDQVTRVAPIGFDAHDFIGEWGNLPWDEAVRWVNPARVDKIRAFYDSTRTQEGYFGGEFSQVEVCDPQRKFWQVSYDGIEDADTLYFQIEQTGKWTFILDDVSAAERPGCTEVDTPRSFQTMFDKPLEW